MNRTAKLLGRRRHTDGAGLDRALRRRLRRETRAERPGGGDRARPDVALPQKKSDKLWKAYDRAAGQLVDWECGGRDRATAERLITRLAARGARLYCTDGYEVYADLIPLGRLYHGKDQTHGIERTHSRQRHWLARFRRRGIVVSKAKRMVEASLALFARFCFNGSIDDLVSISA